MTIHTSVRFESAHEQLGDPSKCGSIHGHNWIAEIDIMGTIGPLGYIVDFKDLKAMIDPLDHAAILHKDDPLVGPLVDCGKKVFTMEKNPTCENLAELIALTIAKVHKNVSWVHCVMHENETSWAESTCQVYEEVDGTGTNRTFEVN